MKSLLTPLMLLAAAVACADEVHVVSRVYGPGAVLAPHHSLTVSLLHKAALEQCPNGFEIVHERVQRTSENDTHMVLEFTCLTEVLQLPKVPAPEPVLP